MLRASGFMYLRYEMGCPIVAIERGVGGGTPDLLGVTADGYLVEVEIKQSMADFRKNEKKWARRVRDQPSWGSFFTGHRIPARSFFLVPAKMRAKAEAELPAGWGLLSIPAADEPRDQYAGIAKPKLRVKAPRDKRALPVSEEVRREMIRHQTGTMSSLLCAIANFVERYQELKRRPGAQKCAGGA